MKALTLGSTKDETWPFLSFFPEGHLSRARGTIHLPQASTVFLSFPFPLLRLESNAFTAREDVSHFLLLVRLA